MLLLQFVAYLAATTFSCSRKCVPLAVIGEVFHEVIVATRMFSSPRSKSIIASTRQHSLFLRKHIVLKCGVYKEAMCRELFTFPPAEDNLPN